MIKLILYFFFNYFAKEFNVHNKSGFGVNFSGYPYNQFVVMPVIIGIITFAKNSIVLLESPVFSIQSVCRIKMGFSRNGYSHFYIRFLIVDFRFEIYTFLYNLWSSRK